MECMGLVARMRERILFRILVGSLNEEEISLRRARAGNKMIVSGVRVSVTNKNGFWIG
jgi:hypothetical protein